MSGANGSSITAIRDDSERARADVPARGSPLGPSADRIATQFRTAALALAEGSDVTLFGAYEEAFGPRDRALGQTSDTDNARAVWSVLGIWAAARITLEKQSIDLDDAARWFFGSTEARLTQHISAAARGNALAALDGLDRSLMSDLLPYAIDPLGSGTRRSVIRSSSQVSARAAKRKGGIYYTPGDVADFMTRWVVGEDSPRVLDPACGTGVFLRSAARQLSRDLPLDEVLARLYGIDVDPLAIDATCFVLTATLASSSIGRAPISIWHIARLNLAQRDTVSVLLADDGLWSPSPRQQAEVAKGRGRLRAALANGPIPSPELLNRGRNPDTLEQLFPEAAGGFAMVGNPPYSPLGSRPDLKLLGARGRGTGGNGITASTNAFLPFLGLMWRVPARDARAALVVPLSIAYNTTQPFRSVRDAMAASGGMWTLRFFDRTPDALFGDDVKQRAAIIFREPSDRFRLRTSGLVRWNSQERASLFTTLSDPVESPLTDLGRGIPKLGSDWEAALYAGLVGRKARLGRTLMPADAAQVQPRTDVSVGSTAYNWLVLYRGRCGVEQAVASRMFVAKDSVQADWAYAVLSSDLVYWLWRVEGDGFHVPTRWLGELPFEWDGSACSRLIASHGKRAWEIASHQPVRATNKGRRTVSFRPDLQGEVPAIDRLILGQLGLDSRLEKSLSHFRQLAINAGRENHT